MTADNTVSRREKVLGLSVLAASFILAVYFLFDSLVNPYVINHDAMLHIFWMQSYRDPALFRGDLSAACGRYFCPGGIAAIYRLASFAWDPLVVSKAVPVFVFSFSSFYVFRLVKLSTGSNYCGLLGAVIFMLSPCYMHRIVGGYARAFGFLLLAMSLYYVMRKKPLAVCLTFICECLFYPVVFPLSLTVYAASLVSWRDRRFSLRLPPGRPFLFVATALACGLLLAGKYALPPDRALGPVPTRAQLSGDPVLSQFGRPGVIFTLPEPSLFTAVRGNLRAPFAPGQFIALNDSRDASLRTLFPVSQAVMQSVGYRMCWLNSVVPGAGRAVFLFFLWVYGLSVPLGIMAVFYVVAAIGLVAGRWRLPREIVFLFCAAIVWYVVARLSLPRLYMPNRYLEYPLRLISLVLFCAGIGVITARLRAKALRHFLRVCLLLAIAAYFSNMNKSIYLVDLSGHRGMYRFCQSLPADTVVAGHPELINGIPLFSHRRDFVNYEPSYPYFTAYWEIISRRTDDFFAAYYSGDFRAIDGFCRSNGIGWFIVDESHFTPRYLEAGDFYFQPFNSRILELAGGRKHFALMDVPYRDRTYVGRGIFAVSAGALRRLASEGQGKEE